MHYRPPRREVSDGMGRIGIDRSTSLDYGIMNGINPKDAIGDTKTPLHLVPKVAVAAMAWVMGLGAKKYGPYNWRENSVRESVYIAAALRHLTLAELGEDIDSESGQPHYAHAMACMAILIDAKATGQLADDRPKYEGVLASYKSMETTSASETAE